jgi:hypothetical protein
MSRYAAMFERLGRRGEAAFGAFVMLGDPDLETSADILDSLVEGGADMLELGIPFSDPIADGPVIQAAAVRALARGCTPADCFGLLARLPGAASRQSRSAADLRQSGPRPRPRRLLPGSLVGRGRLASGRRRADVRGGALPRLGACPRHRALF